MAICLRYVLPRAAGWSSSCPKNNHADSAIEQCEIGISLPEQIEKDNELHFAAPSAVYRVSLERNSAQVDLAQ